MKRYQKGLELLVQQATKHDGQLGTWNILPEWLSGQPRNSCITWARCLTRKLINEGIIPEPDWKKFPMRMMGFANENFAVDLRTPLMYTRD